ncbi:MAG: hypothetical protein DIZ78_09890 [endosymbiont of Escarpia spicata]|uniref:VCBS repeat-containing protein n=1 Tax=endosymbiont of Escarpia spicata TaxID=2200908 RepID=A0A370DLT4_9GAMM|nr:MAG: hypothetical protein DIZ78_09890 [endosymbiont of Escarpia spicata]
MAMLYPRFKIQLTLALTALFIAGNVLAEQYVCTSSPYKNDFFQEITGDNEPEAFLVWRNDTLNLADLDGKASSTLRRRYSAFNTTERVFDTPWVSLTSDALFDANGDLLSDYEPLWGGIGPKCEGRGFVTHTATKYAVVSIGQAVFNSTTEMDESFIKAFVHDTTGLLVKTHTIVGKADSRLNLKRLQFRDYDGDGNAELVVVRRTNKTTPDTYRVVIRTYDLLTGVPEDVAVETHYVSKFTNMNP